MKVAVILILGLAAIASADDDTTSFCTGKSDNNYKDESSGVGFFGSWNCAKYHSCSSEVDTVKYCSYIIPLKQYNPTTRTCAWFWSANCSAADPEDPVAK